MGSQAFPTRVTRGGRARPATTARTDLGGTKAASSETNAPARALQVLLPRTSAAPEARGMVNRFQSTPWRGMP
jgi:hypothetical protein